jgi:very-short-patch-repair endonuclease
MVAWRTRPDRPGSAIERARGFRREMSAGEAKLWKWIRARQFEGLKFRRQVPIGPYIADFCCESHNLIVEVDGGQHQLDEQVARDAKRDGYLVDNGYRVVRSPSLEVLNDIGAALSRIRFALTLPVREGPSAPHPLPPLPLGEGK